MSDDIEVARRVSERNADRLADLCGANELERNTIHDVARIVRHGHKCMDLTFRKDGRDYRFEADWLARLLRCHPWTESPDHMADQDDTALVEKVARAIADERDPGRKSSSPPGTHPVTRAVNETYRMARAAIAAVREHDRVVVSTEEASRRLAGRAVRSIAPNPEGQKR